MRQRGQAKIMSKPDKKPKRRPYVDDGHTVYDMSGLTGDNKKRPTQPLGLSGKEKFAAIRAAFEAYFPMLLLVLGSFLFVMLLIALWLS